MDPPVERTRAGEPVVDPRYDPIYQRGYTSSSDGEPAARSAERADRQAPRFPQRPAPSDGGRREALEPSDEPAEDLAVPEGTGGRTPPGSRRWAALLAVASVILILFGAWAYMVAWPVQFQGWSVVNDQVRTPDGLTMSQVQLSQLAIAVAPQLIVLGVTGILADLAILTFAHARGSR